MPLKLLEIFLIFLVILIHSSQAKLKIKNGNFFDPSTNLRHQFHGVNVVYKLKPFYPPVRDHFDSQRGLSSDDFKLMQKWGFNIIRLYLAWPGVEPVQAGHYDESYLDEIEKIVTEAAAYGIFVLLDVHQDVMSSFTCGEGLPDWVYQNETETGWKSFPFPLPISLKKDKDGKPLIEDCLKHPFFEWYFTSAVNRGFQNFYDDLNGQQTNFVQMWNHVAKRFQKHANVFYEIINEPWAGNIFHEPSLFFERGKSDRVNLFPMYERVHEGIRKVDNETIVMYEPMVGDIDVVGFEHGPGGDAFSDRSVFSYHVYCGYVDPQGDPKIKLWCQMFDDFIFRNRDETAKKLKGGKLLSEFGALSNSTKGIEEIHWVLHEAETRFTSWIYWQYKYYDDITTADMPGTTESLWDVDGELKTAKVKALSRTYVQKSCGDPTKNEFDPTNGHYQYSFILDRCSQETQIFVSTEYYYQPNGYKVTINPSDAVDSMKQSETMVTVTWKDSFVGKTIQLDISPK